MKKQNQNNKNSSQSKPESSEQNNHNNQSAIVEKLEHELEQTKAQLDELKHISQQALADLQNFKRRAQEEKSQMIAFASADAIKDMLPFIDNLNLAVKHASDQNSKDWSDGILATVNQMNEMLKNKGLTQINPQDQAFDHNLHEAMTMGPGKKDQVIQVMETGYLLGDKIIRKAKVIVGNGEETNNVNES